MLLFTVGALPWPILGMLRTADLVTSRACGGGWIGVLLGLLGCWVGGLVGWWVGDLVGCWVSGWVA